MKMNFLRNMAAGAVIGVTAGILLYPELGRGTRRRIRKAGHRMMDTAEDVYDDMKNWAR